MITINTKQLSICTLLGCFLIWLFRLDFAGDNGASRVTGLAPLQLPEIVVVPTWEPSFLEKRLIAFMPRKIPEVTDSNATESLHAEVSKKVSVPKPPSEPVVKTINPMFSQLDDNHQVGLLAIVQENDNRFAILQRVNFASSEVENIKVKDNSTFYGLTLAINSQTQIVLRNADREILLHLFKPRNT